MKIKQERMKNKWSQEYVAEKVGITSSAYGKIEISKRRPSYEVLVKLESLFNLSHRDLFKQIPDDEIIT